MAPVAVAVVQMLGHPLPAPMAAPALGVPGVMGLAVLAVAREVRVPVAEVMAQRAAEAGAGAARHH